MRWRHIAGAGGRTKITVEGWRCFDCGRSWRSLFIYSCVHLATGLAVKPLLFSRITGIAVLAYREGIGLSHEVAVCGAR